MCWVGRPRLQIKQNEGILKNKMLVWSLIVIIIWVHIYMLVMMTSRYTACCCNAALLLPPKAWFRRLYIHKITLLFLYVSISLFFRSNRPQVCRSTRECLQDVFRRRTVQVSPGFLGYSSIWKIIKFDLHCLFFICICLSFSEKPVITFTCIFVLASVWLY